MIDARRERCFSAMGPGSFRERCCSRIARGHPHRFATNASTGESFARLGSGRPLFLEQGIAIEPDTRYRFRSTSDLRDGVAAIDVTLCEKTYQYSFGCKPLAAHPWPRPEWRLAASEFDSGDLGAAPCGESARSCSP